MLLRICYITSVHDIKFGLAFEVVSIHQQLRLLIHRPSRDLLHCALVMSLPMSEAVWKRRGLIG